MIKETSADEYRGAVAGYARVSTVEQYAGLEAQCACVGGGSNVPLGFVSLTENVMMVGMAVWMLAMAL